MARSQPESSNRGVALAVFLVEDSQAARDSLAELLAASTDATLVGQADSEMAATQWLQGHEGEWDLFITDLLLVPGGSGFPLISRAKGQPGAGQVVVFSDFATEAVAQRCRQFGADAVFRKSELEGLLAFVRAMRSATGARD
jgi:two-component system, OmpR family, response regulator